MSEETLLTARRFQVRRVQRTLDDGTVIEKEVIRHPGSVVILPILDGDRVCLIRNYRVAAGKTLIELPAGTLEPGEPPETCAARELTEETGYTAESVSHLTSFYAAPGILDEYMHLFLAERLSGGKPARELGEEIENYEVRFAEAMQLVADGTICDAKTMIGLMLWASQLPGR